MGGGIIQAHLHLALYPWCSDARIHCKCQPGARHFTLPIFFNRNCRERRKIVYRASTPDPGLRCGWELFVHVV